VAHAAAAQREHHHRTLRCDLHHALHFSVKTSLP
jgi:hypothetical protein